MASDARRRRVGCKLDLGRTDGRPTLAAASGGITAHNSSRSSGTRPCRNAGTAGISDSHLHERILNSPGISLRDFLAPTTHGSDAALELFTRMLRYVVGDDAPQFARLLLADSASLPRAVAASSSHISDLTGDDRISDYLALLVEAFNHTIEVGIRAPGVHPTAELVEFFLLHRLAHEPVEVLYALFFNATGARLHERELARGGFSTCLTSPREIARTALNLGAAAVVLAHNHPSGSNKPSSRDVAFSTEVQCALSLADAMLVDHLIVANGTTSSMRKLGLLTAGRAS